MLTLSISLQKSFWHWKCLTQVECLAFRYKINIRVKYEDLPHIINKLNPHGERQVASGVGRNCCFWRAACFHSGVCSWNERHAQNFLIKAQHYPKILHRDKQGSWLTPGLLLLQEREREREEWAHCVPQKHDFTCQLGVGVPLHPEPLNFCWDFPALHKSLTILISPLCLYFSMFFKCLYLSTFFFSGNPLLMLIIFYKNTSNFTSFYFLETPSLCLTNLTLMIQLQTFTNLGVNKFSFLLFFFFLHNYLQFDLNQW